MLQLFSLELGQSVRFAFMLNVPHDDGPEVRTFKNKELNLWDLTSNQNKKNSSCFDCFNFPSKERTEIS